MNLNRPASGSENREEFKRCHVCGFQWQERNELLRDPAVALIGYQVDFVKLASGLFLFNHACGTTLAIPVDDFLDLYHGPFFTESKRGSEECTEKCLYENDLTMCPAECECAFVRAIINIVSKWPKLV